MNSLLRDNSGGCEPLTLNSRLAAAHQSNANQYFVLLILTDGAITDFDETRYKAFENFLGSSNFSLLLRSWTVGIEPI